MSYVSDGSVSWVGGMDTSRSPIDLAQAQYSRACNVFIPRSLGGVKVRHGIHYQHLDFDSKDTRELYEKGKILAEGWFTEKNKYLLLLVVDGYVLKFTPTSRAAFYVENLNENNPNSPIRHWIIRVPTGAIVNNGKDLPIYITEKEVRRTNPENDELPPGRMGIYVQDRLFYSNDTGTLIYASDFDNPISVKEWKLTGIQGFGVPEYNDAITAIGRQKVMLNYAEGGALAFSTRNNLYSVDVRGDRNTWASLETRIGKVTQTVEGFSACSSHSFESFGTNLYFRNYQFGISDLRQSQYQFNNLDGVVGQSIEASYWLENDTDWMLDLCYSRACNSRLFTTVAPEADEEGRIFWNGIISLHPAAAYSNQDVLPRRFESIITGVRPWCLSSVKIPNEKDALFIHSYDSDGINRLYRMVDDSDFDIDHQGNKVEIEGWIETRGYDYGQRFSLKKEHNRFYSLRQFPRSLKINIYSRTETLAGWVPYFEVEHFVGESYEILEDGGLDPKVSMPQTRYQVNTPSPDHAKCSTNGSSFLWVQDRIEFKGPIHLDSFIRSATVQELPTNMFVEKEPQRLSYDYRPDFSYSISNG